MSKFEFVTCPFCEKQIIPDYEIESEEEAAAYAIEHCDCEMAHKEAIKRKNIEKLKDAIEQFGEYCQHRDSELNDEIKSYMLSSGTLVATEEICAVSIKVANLNIKISLTSKGHIVLNFTYKDSKKTEVV